MIPEYTDPELTFFAREALMQKLDNKALKELTEGEDTDLFIIASRILRMRASRSRYTSATHRLNYPIEEVLDDYVNKRKGKQVEARRQLKKRFDGQEHSVQERIMLAFMEHGSEGERNFVYEKLCGEDFWVEEYTSLIQQWWERFRDDKMARVIIRRCPREYLLEHLDELSGHGDYATLCIRTGMTPDPQKMSPQTYLWVLKSIGGQLRFREGERTVLGAVRDYMYEKQEEKPVDTIYGVPYVLRMMGYLGEMGMTDDIIAIDTLERRLRTVQRKEWGNAAIKAIEEEFDFPEYIFKEVQ